VHGTLTLRCDTLLAFLAAQNHQDGPRITLTHLMVKLVGDIMAEHPFLNRTLRWGRLYQRETVDVFVHVAMKDPVTGKLDLSGTVARSPDRKSLAEVAEELTEAVDRTRRDADPTMKRSRDSFRWMPAWLVRPALDTLAFLTHTLNLDLRWLGIPRDPFGGLAITNVGALGLDTAYVPLVPYTRLAVFLALGAVKREPVVEGDELVIGHTLSIHATFDHRIMDGAHMARVVDAIKRRVDDPWTTLGGGAAPAETPAP
jgi:pyruvate dehydrogenase E2 component (dihydrolipoamide acetyltransferase)